MTLKLKNLGIELDIDPNADDEPRLLGSDEAEEMRTGIRYDTGKSVFDD